MKSYLSLVSISAKVHRRQSRMTRLCIILAVFLVTSIFSMAEMWTDGQIEAMRQKHGDWHIAVQNISEDEVEQIREDSKVALSSWYDEINVDADQDYSINGKTAVLYGVEETYVADMMKYPTEGSYPQNSKEVVLSADAKELFGIQVGSKITLHTPAGEFSYTVSGFYTDDEDFNHSIDGSCVYMNRAAFDEVCSLNKREPSPQYCIRFQKESGLKKTIADMKERYALTSENVIENTGVLGMIGASSSENVNDMYPLAAFLFVIILIAGVFMISSCMNSNVAQRTKFFGMMRCIGASKQQIIRFVRLEALHWCKTAIPIGCALGMVICWILCAILRLLVKGEWVDMPLFSISPTGIVSGVVVGVVTVFIAAHSPAKQAAQVSPVAAVSGNIETIQHAYRAADTRFFRVETSLGIHHALSAKKNLVLIAGSFALTIVLFLVFSVCLDAARRLIPSASNFSPDITISSSENVDSIDRSLATQIAELPGVEHAFGLMYRIQYPAEINGTEQDIDLVSYEDFMMSNAEESIASGDIVKVYGDSDYAMTIFSQDSHLDVGDRVKIGEDELEIACVASEGIGTVSGSPTIVCSEETFTRVTGDKSYLMVNVILGNDATEETVDQIQRLAGDNIFSDRREDDSVNYSSYWVIRLAAYGFLVIIALITVLNIMNSISMSVFARIKQYGAMRAVGMGNGQVTRMIAAEAATYAVCGTALGMIFGLLVHYQFYKRMILAHFGGSWTIPVGSLAIILLLVLVSCVLAVYAPAKRMRDMAITDTINDL